MKTANIKTYDDSAAVAQAFASDLLQLAKQNTTPIHIALSGGSTPAILFDILAADYAQEMPWSKLHFWWGDERCVPPTDEQSNYKMTFDHLLSKVEMPEANIHRVKGELDPEVANENYITAIKAEVPFNAGLPVFDLIILGMGADGHTASIFPHEIELLESDQICAVATHPESGQKRVSLTGKVINNANAVSFLVTGSSKADRIDEIFNKKAGYEKLPSSYIKPVNGELNFYFDKAAAVNISQ